MYAWTCITGQHYGYDRRSAGNPYILTTEKVFGPFPTNSVKRTYISISFVHEFLLEICSKWLPTTEQFVFGLIWQMRGTDWLEDLCKFAVLRHGNYWTTREASTCAVVLQTPTYYRFCCCFMEVTLGFGAWRSWDWVRGASEHFGLYSPLHPSLPWV